MLNPPRVPARVVTVQRQFNARARRFAAHDAVVREIERRLVDRLDAIRFAPQRVVDVGCGAGHSHALLRARYGQIEWLGVDASTAMLALNPAARHGWRARLTRGLGRPSAPRVAALADALPCAAERVDLLFSNLMLHWHPAPHTVFPEWLRVLRPDGLLLFSSYGPDTLSELRAACASALPHAAPMPFVDMHDFGDMLVAAGFATPVMDVERLTLTFATPEALLAEVRALGGNPRDDRSTGLPATAAARQLCDALAAQRGADGRIGVTVEVAYGHAWRPPAGNARGETSVSVDALRATLRQRKSKGEP